MSRKLQSCPRFLKRLKKPYLRFSRACLSVTTVSRSFVGLLLLERSYFVLDTESDLVHFFKKTNQTKPYQTLQLYYGVVMNDMNNEQVIVDKVTGKAQNGFRFQFMQSNGKKKKGKLMTVIPEEPEQFEVMVKAF